MCSCMCVQKKNYYENIENILWSTLKIEMHLDEQLSQFSLMYPSVQRMWLFFFKE